MISIIDSSRDQETLTNDSRWVRFKEMRVLGSRLHVRFVQPAERTPGGIWLPDSMKENLSHARVVAVGPGYETASGKRVPTGFAVGDQIVFAKHSSTPLTREEVMVRAEDVIARLWIDEDGDTVVVPENEWVLVSRVAAEATLQSGLVLPEALRRRGRSGNVVDIGPGEVREKGPLCGTRRSCAQIAGLPDDDDMIGQKVFWGPNAGCVELFTSRGSVFLVPAGGLECFESP